MLLMKNGLSVKYLCILLAIVSFALYANTLQNGYVLDDGMVLKDNTIVSQGVKGIPQIFSTPRAAGANIVIEDDFYRPLSMAMFAVEVQLFGVKPVVGHLFNILAFVGCVIMLFLFLDKFFGEKKVIAFIAALLFAMHPIHTEVVANIKCRDELLCYFFGFWSLSLFMSYMKEGKAASLVFGILALFLAFLSKETVITFLVIVPLVFFFYSNDNKRRAAVITGGTVVVAVVFLLIRTAILNKYHANESTAVLDFMDNALVNVPESSSRLATEFLVLGKYLGLMFVPYPLLCNYSCSSIPFVGFGNVWVLLSLLVYLGLLVFAVFRLVTRKKDPWAFAILFYLITIALFSNIPFLIGAEMGERFVFFASTGFCMAVALALEQWLVKARAGDAGVLKSGKVLAVLVPLTLLFGGMTIARDSDWKDEYTLFKADLKKSPYDCRLYQWLGTEIAQNRYNAEPDAGKKKEMDKESIGYFRRALEIYPGAAEVAAQLGWIFQRSNNTDSAIYYNKLALNINPSNSNANHNLGSVYYAMGKYQQAAGLLEKSIMSNPKFKTAYVALANCYIQLKQYDKAIVRINKLLEFDPGNADAHKVIGDAYFRLQNFGAAEDHYKQALATKPNDVPAINSLGVVYLSTKKIPLAIEQFKHAISISPGYANAYSNLGRAYYFAKQYDAAVDILNKAITMEPKNDGDFPILAMCYQQLGKMDLAAKYEEVARQVYPGFKLQ
jgi:protein O-mannosyl-transferase